MCQRIKQRPPKTKQNKTHTHKLNKQKHNKVESTDLPGKEYMPKKKVSVCVKQKLFEIGGCVFFISMTPKHVKQHFTSPR